MANFHPNLTSRSRENVYIKKLSLKFWRTTQKKSGKLRKNAESLPFIKSNVFTAFQIISSSGTLTKKILNLNLHTDGQEEQVKYHWPLESTQISTFSRRKLRYCATPNPQLLRCTAGFQWAKCSPVCPFENDNCCMARLLNWPRSGSRTFRTHTEPAPNPRFEVRCRQVCAPEPHRVRTSVHLGAPT